MTTSYKERCKRQIKPAIGYSVEYIYAGTVHARIYVNGECQNVLMSFPISKFIERDRFKIVEGSIFLKKGKYFTTDLNYEPICTRRRKYAESIKRVAEIYRLFNWE